MHKVISGHTKNWLPVHHKIIVDCKLVYTWCAFMCHAAAWVKHEIVDVKYSRSFLCQAFCGMHRIPNVFKIQFSFVENIVFLSFLINWCIELFLFFTWSYNSRKSGKWINIFLKQSYFRFFGQKTNLISCELKLFILDLNMLNCILTLYFAMS